MASPLDTPAALASAVETAVEAHFPRGDGVLLDCMRYAAFSGGRRMRPVLCLLAADFCGADRDEALPLAAAIEYLHTASLTYDDLPAMDNAAQRRGLPAAHEKFTPGVAMLAGLSLVSHAFKLMASHAALVRVAASCIGHEGMSAGQAIDLAGGNRDGAHYRKTTALFRLALTAPGIACGARREKLAALESFALHLGTAYQLMDDADDELNDGLRAKALTELHAAEAALLPHGAAANPLLEYARRLLLPVLV